MTDTQKYDFLLYLKFFDCESENFFEKTKNKILKIKITKLINLAKYYDLLSGTKNYFLSGTKNYFLDELRENLEEDFDLNILN